MGIADDLNVRERGTKEALRLWPEHLENWKRGAGGEAG